LETAVLNKIQLALCRHDPQDQDELILGKENLMDFLAFTQRFVTKQKESESESDESDADFRSFGFSSSRSKNKRPKKSKKDKKRWKKLCHALIQHGVTIPQTLFLRGVVLWYLLCMQSEIC
jgi:hypothetical protein